MIFACVLYLNSSITIVLLSCVVLFLLFRIRYTVSDTEVRLVMPFLSGGSLEDRVRLDPMWGRAYPPRVVMVTLHLLRGVEALDKARLAHGDRTFGHSL